MGPSRLLAPMLEGSASPVKQNPTFSTAKQSQPASCLLGSNNQSGAKAVGWRRACVCCGAHQGPQPRPRRRASQNPGGRGRCDQKCSRCLHAHSAAVPATTAMPSSSFTATCHPCLECYCIASQAWTVQGIGLSWEQTEQKRLKALGIFSWSITASDEDARMHTATQAHDVGSRQEAVPNGFWNPR